MTLWFERPDTRLNPIRFAPKRIEEDAQTPRISYTRTRTPANAQHTANAATPAAPPTAGR
eukprot:10073677-Lingulodinium_polyedra.AAC.1